MPQVIIMAIAAYAGYAAVASVVLMAYNTVQSNRARKQAQRDAINAYNASLQDRTLVVRSSIMPRNVVLGKDRASGPLWPWFTWGDKRQFHTFGVVLAGHECDSIVSHWFNEDQLTLDSDGWVTAPSKYVREDTITVGELVTFDGSGNGYLSHVPKTVEGTMLEGAVGEGVFLPFRSTLLSTDMTTGSNAIVCTLAAGTTSTVYYTWTKRKYLFRIRSYLGGSGQTAAQELIDAAAAAGQASAWDSTRKGTEVCYSTIQMEADYNTLGQIGVPNYSAVIKGVKAYNTRTATTAWTENPADLARWFLVDSRYSPETLSTEIGTTELEASANVCDESEQFSASRTEARYTCNGQIRTDRTPLENLNLILDSMDGDAVWVGGKFQIVAGYYKTPTLTINEAKLSDADITINPKIPKDKIYNLVTGVYAGPATGYQPSSYKAVNPSAYVTQDNGEVLPLTMDFPLVNDDIRCQMIAWQRLTRERQQLSVTLGTSMKGYDAFPLENVLVTAAEFGWSNKVFAVRRRSLQAPKLTYALQATDSTVWDWSYSNAQAAVTIPATALPDASTVPTVELLDPASGDDHLLPATDGTITSRIYQPWTPVRNGYVTDGGWVQLQFLLVGSSEWQQVPLVPGDQSAAYIMPVVDGATYLIRARAIMASGRRGDWSAIKTHVVIGKTEPPDDVTSFNLDGTTLSWAANTDVDLAGYVIRFHFGANTSWADATPLHDGVITESPYDMKVKPSGQITLMIKAQDRGGNQSATAARIITDLGDPDIVNVVETYDFEAAGWAGTISGGAISGTNIEATSLTAIYTGNDDAPMYSDDESALMYAGLYDSLVWTSPEWSPSSAATGSAMTIDYTATGSAIKIEYRRTGPSAMYSGDDSRPMYALDDTTPMYLAAPDFVPWPGSASALNEPYQWRVTLGGGATQGVLDAFSVTVDVPDKPPLKVIGMAVSSGGSRVTQAAGYFTYAMQSIQITVQGGGTAISADYSDATNLASGPLVYARDASGSAVNGTVSVTIEGY